METKTGMDGDIFKIHGVDTYGELYGSSMAPTIMKGDTVVSERFSGQDLDSGMIVKANISGQMVIHRIVNSHQRDGWIALSGDSADGVQKVKTEQVTHVVKAVVY